MEALKRVVHRAYWRMAMQRFLQVAAWSLFAALLVGAVGLAIPKIWAIPVDGQVWLWSWVGGSFAIGLIGAFLWTYRAAESPLVAAIEIDRRYQLKERVSSTIALTPEERETEAGRALVADAVRRVERIDVREHFQISPTWKLLLPALPALLLAALAVLPDRLMKEAQATAEAKAQETKAIEKASQKLQEQLREAQKRAEAKGLQDGELKEISKQLDKQFSNPDKLDRKEVIIKLNNLAQELEKKRQELGGAEQMKKELGKLKEMNRGPADKMAAALRKGDFNQAQKELEKLQEQMKQGKLAPDDEKKLAHQMEKFRDQLQDKMRQQKQAKKDLEKQVQQKLANGDKEGAEKLQQQLDQMEKDEQQMQQKMQGMANDLADIAQALKEGGKEGQQKAADKMGKLAQKLKAMEKDLQQMDQMQEALDQLADAKNAMQCEQCNGEGCKHCQGGDPDDGDAKEGGKGKGGDKDKQAKNSRNARGKGRGQGEREEEEDPNTKAYDSNLRGDPKKGASVRVGDADGPNSKGVSREELRSDIRSELNKSPDALNEVSLPKDQRENAKQYFKHLREGDIVRELDKKAGPAAEESPAQPEKN